MNDARLTAAQEIAAEASALALSYFGRELTVERKGLQDLVSVADREVEALIRKRLNARFPTDGMLGEEGGGAAADALWVVDPIDGTTNFLHGLPHWCVSIAFRQSGQTELGVILAPVLKETFVARRGKGASFNGQKIAVSRCRQLSDALIGTGSAVRYEQGPYVERIAKLQAAGVEYRRLGSAALHLANVACGRLDAYFEGQLMPWDCAAGMLIVEEAGGRCNDFWRGDALKRGNPVLGACASLYEAVAVATGIT